MVNKSNNTTKDTVRAPIVTIMGHVDHGKTSILDYIRKTNIQAKEHGGITQHIGAYQITHNGHPITFIDTPGHAAFSQMRARGGRASDIVVLVVAADSSVQPQTQEAIKHAQAAGTHIIVAINKVDLSTANVAKVKQDLATENVVVEEWGGDIISIEVSAKTGKGIDELLNAIIAVGELLELKASPTNELEAIIIETKRDRQKGVIVSCIVKDGTLRVGTEVTASGQDAKIRSMTNDRGVSIQEASLSLPVEVLGFKTIPNVGDLIVQKGSELAALTIDENRVEIIGQDTKKRVELVLKADTQGTLEAVKTSLANLITESAAADFSIRFSHTATGDITDSDILLASSTKGLVFGFGVKYKSTVKELAEDLGVTMRTYNTIYELIDNVKEILEGKAFTAESKIKGRAEVMKIFALPSGDTIAGCYVVAGALKPDASVSIYEKNPAYLNSTDTPLYSGKIRKLKHGKDDISVAGKNTECGVLLQPTFTELKAGLWIDVS